MGSPERPEFGSPIPLSDIEDVLAWVDTFKLSRPTKKINRDFADGVLLAEILAVFYPKLVEMHNYPPRNSQAQKLNNWMTLNRKVLKKLKLNLCLKTMEQLSNSIPGAVERVLLMVREKVKRDEVARCENREQDQNASSGGSYYEACSEEDNVLLVPVKQRGGGGSLEMVQKKVVSHEAYLGVQEQLRDAREANDTLKQKVDHFDNIIKMKIERIEELQRQLSRKTARRKESEELRNTLSMPNSLSQSSTPRFDAKINDSDKPDEKEVNFAFDDNQKTVLKNDKSKLTVRYDIADDDHNIGMASNVNMNEFVIDFEQKQNISDTKERKSECKVDLRSKIPVYHMEIKEQKPEKQENILTKEVNEIMSSNGDEDEMNFYN